MKENSNVTIGGLKCDSPTCDWRDDSIKYEDYPNWINKSCPKCGENVLTEKDYKNAKIVIRIAKFFEPIDRFICWAFRIKRKTVEFEVHDKIRITQIKDETPNE